MAQAIAPKKEALPSPVRVATFSITSGGNTLVNRFLHLTQRKYVTVESGRGTSFSCLDAPLDRSCLVHFEGGANVVIENGNDRHYITLSDVDLRIDTYPTRGYAYEHVNASMYRMNIGDALGSRTIVVAYAHVLGLHPAHSYASLPAPTQGLIPLGGSVKEIRGMVEKESEDYHNAIKSKILSGELTRGEVYRMGFTPNSLARIMGEGKKNSGKKKNPPGSDGTDPSEGRQPSASASRRGKKSPSDTGTGDANQHPHNTTSLHNNEASGTHHSKPTLDGGKGWGGANEPPQHHQTLAPGEEALRNASGIYDAFCHPDQSAVSPQFLYPPTSPPNDRSVNPPPGGDPRSSTTQNTSLPSAPTIHVLPSGGDKIPPTPGLNTFSPPGMSPNAQEAGTYLSVHRTVDPTPPTPRASIPPGEALYAKKDMYELVTNCTDLPPPLMKVHPIQNTGRTFFKRILFHGPIDEEAIPSLPEMPLVNMDLNTASFEVCGCGIPSYLAILEVTGQHTAVAVHNHVDLECAERRAV